MSRLDSLKLAWKTMWVDFRFDSQSTKADETKRHAMAGTLGDTERVQTKEEALSETSKLIEKSLKKEGKMGDALHAIQDWFTPRHDGEEWKGPAPLPIPLSKDLFSQKGIKKHFEAFKEFWPHAWDDFFPSEGTRDAARRGTIEGLKGNAPKIPADKK